MNKPLIDLEKDYGIVLEGGGARGAYQIGAWKALKEAGVKIKGVAGTSVGALNGALICMDDLEKAEHIWREISYSKVMKVEDSFMNGFFHGEVGLRETIKEVFHMIGEGGIDITPLKELIQTELDEEQIRNSDMDFFLLTFSVSEMKELDLSMEDIPEGLLSDFLLASAYLIFFKTEKLHGKTYMDGGMINNVPLGSMVSRGYKDIIMIRIFGPGREKKVKLTEEETLYSIEPRVNLGNIIDFNPKKSSQNMKIGYYDAMRFLYGLEGMIYYIDQTEEECYYVDKLISVGEEQWQYLAAYYTEVQKEYSRTRNILEVICPLVAKELRLPRDWNYRQIYIAVLEAAAKMLRIQKYKIYTVEELLQAVQQKITAHGSKKLPPFIYILNNFN